MADLELWEIENEVVARITAQVSGIQAKAADTLDADAAWLVQHPPAVLVACHEERKAPDVEQPICKGATFEADIVLVFCFSGMRPRGVNRTDVGHALLASVRDALWYFRLSAVRSPLDYLGLSLPEYDERARKLYIRQLYVVRTSRRAII
jgi:hypothetical protein